jgi:hypothetical protein
MMKRLFLFGVFLLSSVAVRGDYDFIFSVVGGEAVVEGPNTVSMNFLTGTVDITATVTDGVNTYPVTAIAAKAFFGQTSLASVTLSQSLAYIGDSAFAACTSLTSVILPHLIPPTLGGDVFTGVSEQCLFSIPFGSRPAYSAAEAWRPFFPPVYNVSFRIENGQAVITAPNSASPDWGAAHIVLPTTVYANAGRTYPVGAIAPKAFANYPVTSSLTFPSTLTAIGDSAFAGYTAAAFTFLSPAPPQLGKNVFAGIPRPPASVFTCPETSLGLYRTPSAWQPFFPDYDIVYRLESDNTATVTAPNPRRFSPATAATAIVIPATVLHQSVVYPVAAIAPAAFAGCTALSSIDLQLSTPPALGEGAFADVFENCDFLCSGADRTVYTAVPAWYPYFPPIYNILFRVENGQAIVTGLNGESPDRNAEHLALPLTVTRAGRYRPVTAVGSKAFKGLATLTAVTLHESITAIGDSAFAGCTGLTAVTLLPADPPTLGNDVFADVPLPPACVFTCPETALNRYRIPPAWHPFFPDYDFSYRLEGDQNRSVAVIGPNPRRFNPVTAATAVVIPETILHQGVRYPVTAFAANAFAGCTVLTSIDLQLSTPPTLGTGALADISPNCIIHIPDGAHDAYIAVPAWLLFFPSPVHVLFRIEDGHATVTGPNTEHIDWNARHLTFPPTVIKTGQIYPVTAIAPGAFRDLTSLESVTFHSGIMAIGDMAFAGCTGLTAVTLLGVSPPDLAGDAFDGVPRPPACAFTCPEVVLNVYRNFAAWCPYFPDYDITYRIENGRTATATGPSPLRFKPANSATAIVVPDTIMHQSVLYPVTAIAPNAFAWCSAMRSITLLAGITRIEEGTFTGCASLTAITLPDSITDIGARAFAGCSSLKAVPLPDSITTISDSTFADCVSLPSITLPESITGIGTRAFAGCASLRAVTLPAAVSDIGTRAFADCVNLTAVTVLAETPPVLGEEVFAGISPRYHSFGCPPSAIETYRDAPQWSSFFPPLFYDFNFISQTATITGFNLPIYPDLTDITIPDAILRQGTLYTVDSIAPKAFAGCNQLTAVTLLATSPPALGADAFTDVPERCTFTCPKKAEAFYTATPAWTPFFPPVYDVTFLLAGNQAAITGFNTEKKPQFSGHLNIPAVIYRNAGRAYTVTTIAPDAFSGHPDAFSVTLPAGITLIAADAFAGCNKLSAVTLLSVSPPTLESGTFTGIPAACLFSCPALTRPAYAAVPAWKTYFPTYNVLYRIEKGQAVITAPNAESVELNAGIITIPDSVYNAGTLCAVGAIASGAFAGNFALRSVTIPKGVGNIGDNAFSSCTALTAVTLLCDVPPTLGGNAFDGISKNCVFTCPQDARDSYSDVAAWVPFFPADYDFTFRIENEHAVVIAPKESGEAWLSGRFTLPSTVYAEAGRIYPVTVIGTEAFKGRTSLKTLVLPASISDIGISAFDGCTALDTVIIRAPRPPILYKNAFLDVPLACTFICPTSSLSLYRNSTSWRPFFYPPIYDVTFRIENGCALVTGLNADGPNYPSESLTIPESVNVRYAGTYPVTTIVPNAFAGQEALKKLSIAASVAVIGNNAFSGCSNLADVYLSSLVPPLHGLNAFASISADAIFACPKNALPNYRKDPDWVAYFPLPDTIDPDPIDPDPIDPDDPDDPDPIDPDDPDDPPTSLIPVIAPGSQTPVTGASEDCCLYNLRGQIIYRGPVTALPTLPHGLYLLTPPTPPRKIRL